MLEKEIMVQGKKAKAEPPAYAKGDFRRTAMVLGAVQTCPGATLLDLVGMTGLDKKTVFTALRTATVQMGVHIKQEGPRYEISDWGRLLTPEGAVDAFNGTLVGSFTQDGAVIDDPLPQRKKEEGLKLARKGTTRGPK
jgi:hypothetical protein